MATINGNGNNNKYLNATKFQAEEYFLFAGIMGVAVIIFTIMALPYKYANDDTETGEKSKEKMDEDNGEKKNLSINESVSSTDTESLKQDEEDSQ